MIMHAIRNMIGIPSPYNIAKKVMLRQSEYLKWIGISLPLYTAL